MGSKVLIQVEFQFARLRQQYIAWLNMLADLEVEHDGYLGMSIWEA